MCLEKSVQSGTVRRALIWKNICVQTFAINVSCTDRTFWSTNSLERRRRLDEESVQLCVPIPEPVFGPTLMYFCVIFQLSSGKCGTRAEFIEAEIWEKKTRWSYLDETYQMYNFLFLFDITATSAPNVSLSLLTFSFHSSRTGKMRLQTAR